MQYVVSDFDSVDARAKARRVTVEEPLSDLAGFSLRAVWLNDPEGPVAAQTRGALVRVWSGASKFQGVARCSLRAVKPSAAVRQREMRAFHRDAKRRRSARASPWCGAERMSRRQAAVRAVIAWGRPQRGLDAEIIDTAEGRGVVVNDYMDTSDPDVFAVGECVEHRGVCHGLIAPSSSRGKVLPATMTGNRGATYAGTVPAATSAHRRDLGVVDVCDPACRRFTRRSGKCASPACSTSR
jgi:hypothetical protein